MQVPWQAWHFVTCAENCARSIDFEVAKLRGSYEKTRRKTSILKLQSVKIGEIVSHEMLVLVLPSVLSAVSMRKAGKHLL